MTIDSPGEATVTAGPPGECVVRVAGREDAALLAGLGERSFREAWEAYNTTADMDAYCAVHFTEPATLRDLGRSNVGFLLAWCGGDPAGYLRWATGPAPTCVTAASPLEISRVYVLRRWHGRGVGPALMARCLELAATAGHDVAWLAVWQRAPQALVFYRKWGFAIVGSVTFRLGTDVQQDHVMARGI